MPPDRGRRGVCRAAGETRVINLTTDTSMPVGKSAAIVNLTVVNTPALSGFLSIYSQAVTITGEPTFSNINWSSSGQILANTTTTAVASNGQIKIYSSGITDVLVDVIGYYP